MTVRLATADDLADIVEMGRRFHAFSGERVPYDDGSAWVSAQNVMAMGFVLIAEAEGVPVGMIGVAIVPLFFNFAESMAQELMWWVDEDERGTGAALRLVRAAEHEARNRGASRMHMLRLPNSPEHVGTLYDRLGYRLGEIAHVKEF